MSMSTKPVISASKVLTLCAMLSTPSTAGQRTSGAISLRQLTLFQLLTVMLCGLAVTTLSTSTSLLARDGTVGTPSHCCHILLFWWETSIAITPTGAIKNPIWTVTSSKTGHRAMTTISSTTQNKKAPFIQLDGRGITRLTFAGSPWLTATHSQPLVQS